jgi:hypothetical protein
VEGDPERAALLAGAAEGLRRRVGLRAWPLQRQGEAELVAQIRKALGADRFDPVFAAGERLTRREAVPPSATGATLAPGRPDRDAAPARPYPKQFVVDAFRGYQPTTPRPAGQPDLA